MLRLFRLLLCLLLLSLSMLCSTALHSALLNISRLLMLLLLCLIKLSLTDTYCSSRTNPLSYHSMKLHFLYRLLPSSPRMLPSKVTYYFVSCLMISAVSSLAYYFFVASWCVVASWSPTTLTTILIIQDCTSSTTYILTCFVLIYTVLLYFYIRFISWRCSL